MNFFYKSFLLALVTCSTAEANPPDFRIVGIAAIKEQVFHGDASAKIVPYTSLVDDRSYVVKIDTGKAEFVFERSKLAGTVDLLESLPSDIRKESELAPVRSAHKNLSNFATRFPKSEPLLKSNILALAAHISSFEQGARRLDGRWVDKKTIEDSERAEVEKVAEAKRTEEKNLAEIDRLERLRMVEIQRDSNLKSEEAARVDRARTQSIELQGQVLAALGKGDVDLAVALMKQATRASSNASLNSFAKGLELFIALTEDKSLKYADTDWKNPRLPDADLFQKISVLLPILSNDESQDIHPELARLPEGLLTANLFLSFIEDYRAKGDGNQTYPIHALQNLRKSEVFRKIHQSDSFFSKPFVSRLSALNTLIGPKVAEYEAYVADAKKLEKNKQFQEAALKYRAALGLEPSAGLESAISACEEKTTGF